MNPHHLISYLLFVFFQFTSAAFAQNKLDHNFQLNQPGILNKSYFVKNIGQIVDQNRKPNNDVLYKWGDGNLSVLLRKNGFSYEIKKRIENNKFEIARIDFNILNCNQNNVVIEEHESIDTSIVRNLNNKNYPKFERIVYKNILNNIGIEFLIHEGSFKYNFMLENIFNLKNLEIEISGAIPYLNEAGNLALITSVDTLYEKIPRSYYLDKSEKQNEAFINYEITNKHTFKFVCKNPEKDKKLIIDPLPWGTYISGSSSARITSLAQDKNGNILAFGHTNSEDIATSGAYQTILNGYLDYYIAKFNEFGKLKWITYWGGNHDENSRQYEEKLVLDSFGNIFINGLSTSTDIATRDIITDSRSERPFLAKLDSNGKTIWCNFYSGNLHRFCIDRKGSIYFGGEVARKDVVLKPKANAYQTSIDSINGIDCYITKLDSIGNFIWATYYGGLYDQNLQDITTDDNNNLHIVGANTYYYKVDTIPGHNFYASFNPDGIFRFETLLGGYGQTKNMGIAIDKTGNTIVYGTTSSDSAITTPNSETPKKSKFYTSGFVQKYTSYGQLIWGTYIGGKTVAEDYITSLCVDSDNNLLLTGHTTDAQFATKNALFNKIYLRDVFVLKLDPFGFKKYGTYLGGVKNDYSRYIISGRNNEAIVVGYTKSPNGFSFGNGDTLSYRGVDAGFIAYLPIPNSISNNYIQSSQILCNDTLPKMLYGSTPTNGYNEFTYKWLMSTNDSIHNFKSAQGENNQINYFPEFSHAKTWYKRVVYSYNLTDTSNTVFVKSSDKLRVNFSVNAKNQCFNNNLFNFQDSTNSANSWKWKIDEELFSTNKNFSYSFKNKFELNHKVCLIAKNDTTCFDTICKEITLLKSPDPFIISGENEPTNGSTYIYSVPTRIGSSYQWLFKNGIGNSNSNQIAILWKNAAIDTIRTIEKDSNQCLSDTMYLPITIKAKTGINSIQNTNLIQLFPNPTKQEIYLTVHKSENIEFVIYNTSGKKVKEGLFDAFDDEPLRINVEDLSEGLYFIHVLTEHNKHLLNQSFEIIH